MNDPRLECNKHHILRDIIVIASMGGTDKRVEVENFRRTKQRWLQQFLALPDGKPSHDTFGRVFPRLKPEQFQACFQRVARAVFARTGWTVSEEMQKYGTLQRASMQLRK